MASVLAKDGENAKLFLEDNPRDHDGDRKKIRDIAFATADDTKAEEHADDLA